MRISVASAARHFLVVFALSMTIHAASAMAQDSGTAIGALTGDWTVNLVMHQFNMRCQFDSTMTLHLVDTDGTITGRMDGWRVSCRGTYRSETQSGITTTESSFDATFPPAAVSGSTDGLRAVRLRFRSGGSRAQFEGELFGTSMSGSVTFYVSTQRLGDLMLDFSWGAMLIRRPMPVAETPAPSLTPRDVDLVVPPAAAPTTTDGIAETRFAGFSEQRGAFGRVAPAPGGGVQFALNAWAQWKGTVYLSAVQAPLPPAGRVTMVWENSSDRYGSFGIVISDDRVWGTRADLVLGGVRGSYYDQLILNYHSKLFARNPSGVDTLVIDFRDSAIAAFVDSKLLMQCVARSRVGGSVLVYAQSSASSIIRLVRVEPLKSPAAEAPTIAPGECQEAEVRAPGAPTHVDLVAPAAAALSTTQPIAETRFAGLTEQRGAFGRVAPAPGGGVQFSLSDKDHWRDTVYLSAVRVPDLPAARVTMKWEETGGDSGTFGIRIGAEYFKQILAAAVDGPWLRVSGGEYGHWASGYYRRSRGLHTLVMDLRDSAVAVFVDSNLLMQCVASSPVRGPVQVFGLSSASAIIRLVRVEPLKSPAAVAPTRRASRCELPHYVDLVVPAAAAPPSARLAAETRFTGLRDQRGAFGRIAPAAGGGMQFALNRWYDWTDTVYLPAVHAPLPPAGRVTMVWEDSISRKSGPFGIAIGDEPATRTWAEIQMGMYSGVPELYLKDGSHNRFDRNRSGVDTLVIEFRGSAIAFLVDGKLLLQCVARSPVGGRVRVFGQSSASATIRLVRVGPLKSPAAPTPTIAPGQCRSN